MEQLLRITEDELMSQIQKNKVEIPKFLGNLFLTYFQTFQELTAELEKYHLQLKSTPQPSSNSSSVNGNVRKPVVKVSPFNMIGIGD